MSLVRLLHGQLACDCRARAARDAPRYHSYLGPAADRGGVPACPAAFALSADRPPGRSVPRSRLSELPDCGRGGSHGQDGCQDAALASDCGTSLRRGAVASDTEFPIALEIRAGGRREPRSAGGPLATDARSRLDSSPVPSLLLQPHGNRLGDVLNLRLQDPRWTTFRAAVAFVKRTGVIHISDSLRAFAQRGHVRMTVGVSMRGTSVQGLESLLDCLDGRGEVWVFHNENGPTFHPKMYVFSNDTDAEVIIGSGNLTRGGLFDNYEASISLALNLANPDDRALFTGVEAVLDAYTDPVPGTALALSDETLRRLRVDGYVLPEQQMLRPERRPVTAAPEHGIQPGGGRLFRHVAVPQPPTISAIVPDAPTPRGVDEHRGLAIQIKPHRNGEIFLSVTATRQNPEFFGWPFTGHTTPKKPGNPSYPQRIPDPIVNIAVYGPEPLPTLVLNRYALNTVYYETNREIRITAAPLVREVPEYSIMILERSDIEGVDYEITIYRPDSPDHRPWLDLCDQPMPSGGRTPRRFGWF